jgi:hypothetical protein
MKTATIKLFLVNGDPNRLKTAEISNWTGKAISGPRSNFEDILGRPESEQTGVYFLYGVDPETGEPAVYIGEAAIIKQRLKQHLVKDYWNTIVFVVSKDENLNKAHAQYLEGRLIQQAKEAGRVKIMNSQESGTKLSEADRADMEIFLDRIHQLMPILGADFLVPKTILSSKRTKKNDLLCEIKNVKAAGRFLPTGFIVFKDSQAVLEERPSTEKFPFAHKLRQELLAKGKLTQENDCLRFTEDIEFSSPSAAAAVIHGGNANGLTAWKNADGLTLKEIEDKES